MEHLKKRISVRSGMKCYTRTPSGHTWPSLVKRLHSNPPSLCNQTGHPSLVSVTPRITKYRQGRRQKGEMLSPELTIQPYLTTPQGCAPESCDAVGWVMSQFSCETEFLVTILVIDLSSSEEDEDEDKSSERCSKTRGSSVTQMRQLRSFQGSDLESRAEKAVTVLVQLFVPLCFWHHPYLPSTFKMCIKFIQASVPYFS